MKTRCPICGLYFDATQSVAMPFCSERCRRIDMGRWLDERYGLPELPDDLDDVPAEDESTDDATS